MCEDITKLKWLLVPERINFTIAKRVFNDLLKENVLENLEIQVRNSYRSLRTINKVTLEYTNLRKQQTFYINYANTLYSELPNEIKKYEQLRKCFIDKTTARVLSISQRKLLLKTIILFLLFKVIFEQRTM